MPRSRRASCVVGALTVLGLAAAVAVGASWGVRARLEILAVRGLVVVARAMPPGFSELLTTILGVGGSPAARLAPPAVAGGDGPILVVTAASSPFSRYLVEILQAEGLNAVALLDVSQLSASALRSRTVVVLGEMVLDDARVALLSAWVDGGGTLVAMRPDRRLGDLLGVSWTGGVLSDAYLRVDTVAGPGVGIVGESMRFHGTADLVAIREAERSTARDPEPRAATVLATLFHDAATPTRSPAVTMRRVGGGVAVAFVYDLARSVVYTRQGNPAWAGRQRRDVPPRRSVDLFVGPAPLDDTAPDPLGADGLAVPVADEQQRLLANVIVHGSLPRQPLPRFWYLPSGWNAAVVMTGDAHVDTAIQRRLDRYREDSPMDCSVDDWECVRATTYVLVGTTFTPAQAEFYTRLGFEIALHVHTGCADWEPASLAFLVGLQRRHFQRAFPGIPAPATNRTHCVAWSDWSTQPEIEATHGVRLDANYYFYPASWARGRAALFNGSGFPMRFAARDGSVIDCYQAATQIPDESGLPLPQVIDALLDRANGPEGYYGVITANMHFDHADHPGSDAIVASARAHGVPVVSARQMLQWLDARNGSSFRALRWNDETATFTVTLGAGARNLRGMLPMQAAVGRLASLTRDGIPIPYAARTVKGIAYAFFAAEPGSYRARYGPAVALP